MDNDRNLIDAEVPGGTADQPVSGDTQVVPAHRAEEMNEPAENTAEPQEAAAEEQGGEQVSEPELPKLQPNRVVRQAPPSAPTRREVPVPAALLNATRPGKATRRPVEEPGYMRRVPLGQTSPEIEAARNSVSAETRRQSSVQATPAVQGRQTVVRPASQGRQTVVRPAAQGQRMPDAQSRAAAPQRVPANQRPMQTSAALYDNEEFDEDRRPRVWIGLLCILFFLSACVIGLLMVPENDTGFLGKARSAVVSLLPGHGHEAELIRLTVTPENSKTYPCELEAIIETNLYVTDVRLTGAEGNELDTEQDANRTITNKDHKIWVLKLQMNDAYDGMIYAQVRDESQWLPLDKEKGKQIMIGDADLLREPVTGAASEPEPTPAAETEELPEDEPAPAETAQDEPETSPAMLSLVTAKPAAPTPVPTLYEAVYTAVQATPVPTAEPIPDVTAGPTAAPRLTASSVAASDPSLIVETAVYAANGKKLSSYDRETNQIINMPAGQNYYYNGNDYGVLTFRGNAFRQNAASGRVGDSLSGMKLLWKTSMSAVKGDKNQTYAGVTWTGQPVIIKWSATVRELSNIVDDKKYVKGLTEVIVAGNDGYIYFLDLADGQATRKTINVGYPMRGTPSIHPYFYPLMTVGQYARKVASGQGKIGLRYFNLLSQKAMGMIDGTDKDSGDRSYSKLGSFETSALYDPVSDTMVALGSSGILYLTNLGTSFDYNAGTLSISPDYVAMTSRASKKQSSNAAVESSFAMYQSYIWYADMDGVLRCVDTSSLTTQWAVKTGDAVEAAIALDLDGDNLWLYTGNELKNRSKGSAQIRRYNAMNGSEDWILEIPLTNKKNSGTKPGVVASPVVGENDLSDLVFFTVSCLSAEAAKQLDLGTKAVNAATLAVNKNTGKVMWAVALSSYTESSPVAVYNKDGHGWIIQCASDGTIQLLDGRTGMSVASLKVEGTISASPAVYGSTLVIGTTGKKSTSFLYGISLLSPEDTVEEETAAE